MKVSFDTDTQLALDAHRVTQYLGKVNLLEICIVNPNTWKDSWYDEVSVDYSTLMVSSGYTIWVYPTNNMNFYNEKSLNNTADTS